MRKTKNAMRIPTISPLLSAIGCLGLLLGHFILIGTETAHAANICETLESQLAQAMRGTGGNRVSREHDRAIADQNKALKRSKTMSRQRGCARGVTRFSSECRAINRSVSKMRANLKSLERGRNRAGGGTRDNRKVRRILAALDANACGAGFRQAKKRREPGGLFAMFNRQFSRRRHGVEVTRAQPRTSEGISRLGYGGRYRTVCVRKCDGYFFPVSFSTSPGKFNDDAQQCANMCQGAETELYVFNMPSETLEDSVSLTGVSYMSSPNALRYQNEYVEGCTCQASQAKSMLEAVREQKSEAELRVATEAGHLSSSKIDSPIRTSDEARDRQMAVAWLRKNIARPKRPKDHAFVDPKTLREAKSDIRDVSKRPHVDSDEIPERFVINLLTYPPLPIRRPDPLDGQQLSFVQ